MRVTIIDYYNNDNYNNYYYHYCYIKLTSSEIPFMVSRVSMKVIAICMVSAVIVVGVVPDSKASALVSR